MIIIIVSTIVIIIITNMKMDTYHVPNLCWTMMHCCHHHSSLGACVPSVSLRCLSTVTGSLAIVVCPFDFSRVNLVQVSFIAREKITRSLNSGKSLTDI